MRLNPLVLAALSTSVLACGAAKGHIPGGDKLDQAKKAHDQVSQAGPQDPDPNACNGFTSAAAPDAGRKLKAFIEATQALAKETDRTVQVVKESCILMGNELGMTEADYKGETKDICAAVYGKLKDGMQVAFKGKAGLKVKVTPAVCRVDAKLEAQAAAQCEAKASADISATCTGVCHGKCDGKCSGSAGTGGSGGECNGQCSGSCQGSCEGHADVNASAQCKASASVKAAVDVQCTPPAVEVTADAKLTVDKSKAEMTIKAIKAGLPKILDVKARLDPLGSAVATWAASARELKDAGAKAVDAFKDQALCVTGQIAGAVKAIGHIEANVSVSVEVSASASGSIGG